MEKVAVLIFVLALVTAEVIEPCADGNCTDSVPVVSIHISSSGIPFPFPFPFPLDPMIQPKIDGGDSPVLDNAIDPVQDSKANASQEEPFFSINFMEVIQFSDDDSETDSEADSSSVKRFYEGPQVLFGNVLDDLAVADFSGQSMTGEELADKLRVRKMIVPVKTLILSNSRISGMNAGTLAPIESTLEDLRMDNSSANLGAVLGLTSLKKLNLSNNGLSTFEWLSSLQDSLEVLDLSHNQFVEVSPEISLLNRLQELYLNDNKITSVSEYPLVLLPDLRVLSLTKNALTDAVFTGLHNLRELSVDWNYLWRSGRELRLPSQRLRLRLASNPWRCDCGLLEARDSHDVLDLDQLQCANEQSFTVCEGCQRYFLPMENGLAVSNLTKDSIAHLGCTGLSDQYYLLRDALGRLRDEEPEKLAQLSILLVVTMLACVAILCLCCSKCRKQKKFNRHAWLRIQQIPYLKVPKPDKPQEVPYIKIDEPITA